MNNSLWSLTMEHFSWSIVNGLEFSMFYSSTLISQINGLELDSGLNGQNKIQEASQQQWLKKSR